MFARRRSSSIVESDHFEIISPITAEHVVQIADESVDVSLASRLLNDPLVIIVAKTPGQFFVIHLGLVFTIAPTLCNLRGGEEEELSEDDDDNSEDHDVRVRTIRAMHNKQTKRISLGNGWEEIYCSLMSKDSGHASVTHRVYLRTTLSTSVF